MKTFTITGQNFLDWYFNSGDDDELVDGQKAMGEQVIEELFEKGTSTITIESIFDKANFECLQVRYLEEFDNDNYEELGDMEIEYKIELLK
jgi:hypothetical protein